MLSTYVLCIGSVSSVALISMHSTSEHLRPPNTSQTLLVVNLAEHTTDGPGEVVTVFSALQILVAMRASRSKPPYYEDEKVQSLHSSKSNTGPEGKSLKGSISVHYDTSVASYHFCAHFAEVDILIVVSGILMRAAPRPARCQLSHANDARKAYKRSQFVFCVSHEP